MTKLILSLLLALGLAGPAAAGLDTPMKVTQVAAGNLTGTPATSDPKETINGADLWALDATDPANMRLRHLRVNPDGTLATAPLGGAGASVSTTLTSDVTGLTGTVKAIFQDLSGTPQGTSADPLHVSSGAGTLTKLADLNTLLTLAVGSLTSTSTALNLSLTPRTVSSPISLNVSQLAGVTAPAYRYRLSVSGTTAVGILWAETNSATWPCNACFSTLAVNALPALVDNLAAGTHLHLSPVSTTDISGTAAIGVGTEMVR